MATPLFVKVCGLRTEEDVDTAVRAGGDAIGFVFADSPRRVDVPTALRLARRVPEEVLTVGVFRNQPLPDVRSIANITGIRGVQLHGREDRAYFDALKTGGWSLIRGTAFRDRVPRCGAMGEDLLLLDAPVPGAGVPWDWTRKRFTAPGEKWLLAGGLDQHNVTAAIRATGPWGVDVSSGVESSRGVKDPELIVSFIKAARAAE
ncbi:phosphoribosylanthranilate isomerase [Streptomyces albus]|uniref:phosphoribosylanthranilate isomerase n=1 Tax=Streptomyces albus TaxID=1888 RepID=UPI0004C7FF1A|nr:phosphoribosylanthranilate isomerase [Streptomyces albus]